MPCALALDGNRSTASNGINADNMTKKDTNGNVEPIGIETTSMASGLKH